MPDKKGRFVRTCQQLLAVGCVTALAGTVAVVPLDIVGPASPADDDAPAAGSAALVASRPVTPEVEEVPIKGLARAERRRSQDASNLQRGAGRSLAALTPPTEVSGYATVGVTWGPRVRLGDDDVRVAVRTRTGDTWSTWQTVQYEAKHGPTAGTAEARNARQGTEPIVVGDVDQVQVRIETANGRVPADAALAVVDPQDTPAPRLSEPAIDTAELPEDGAASLSSATSPPEGESTDEASEEGGDDTETAGPGDDTSTGPTEDDGVLAASVGVTPKPRIFSRAQWGADESLRDKSSLRYYEIHAGFVHHTVNANNYTRDQVPALLRGIYAYHTKGKGWSDIGYNFVVDRFGRIWEGRYGGVDRPVVGAHTLGYNEYSFAMSALGNFEKVKPTRAMLRAYGRLFGWKLSLHGVSANSMKQRVGKSYFPAVNGHRDAGSTACPGDYLYARLGRIRRLATKYQAPFTDRTRVTDVAGSPWPDLFVREAATGNLHLVRTGGQTNWRRARMVATGWGDMDLVAAAHDLDGDGSPDVVARDSRTGNTGVYLGTHDGGVTGPMLEMTRFQKADLLVGGGDITRDGNNDLVGRMAGSKNLWVYPGKGNGSFAKRRRISDQWRDYDLTAAGGDLNGDGRDDLVARKDGTLYLVPGRYRGIGDPVELPLRWGQYSQIAGGGDITHDGVSDLVVKLRRNGRVFVVPGDGEGGFEHRIGPFQRFTSIDHLAVVGDLDGAAGGDLIGVNPRGRLRLYPNNGNRNIEAVTDTGLRFPYANLLLNVGDWNGDGHGDFMVRTGRGLLQLWPGDGEGGFGPARRVAKGWNHVRLVAAVGDITGDGHPDLMGQPVDEAMRIYPGDGETGLLPSYVAHSPISSDRHTGLGLWDSDGSPDSLLRRDDGAIVLYPGNGPGGLTNPDVVGRRTLQYDWLESLGDATGDGLPDVVARHKKSGKLWVLPGRKDGFGARRLVAVGFDAYDLSS